MLGIFIILLLSWLLLFYFEKENLLALGILPLSKTVLQFCIGFCFIALVRLAFVYVETKLHHIQWIFNSAFSFGLIFKSFWYHLKSAVTEDLVFRGAVLYILISKFNFKKAILLSAICFGIYHWFTYGLSGTNLIPYLFVFLVTGFMGYVWAYSFYKTKSIFLGLGFHIGWNFISTLFDTTKPYGEILFKANSTIQMTQVNSFVLSILKGLLVPFLTLLFINWVIKKEQQILLK